MQVVLPSRQTHTVEQADESIIMISVQVRNEDMTDLAPSDLIPVHLDLGPFATVDQKQTISCRHHLCGGVTIEHREC